MAATIGTVPIQIELTAELAGSRYVLASGEVDMTVTTSAGGSGVHIDSGSVIADALEQIVAELRAASQGDVGRRR